MDAAMLHDRARIFVQGGRGGDGVVSFRREAHVPRGGPDGGDGGRGGDVVLVCDPSLRDLQGFRRKAHWKAARGRHGEGSLRQGADGGTLEVRLPPGTVVEGLDGERFDLVHPGQRAVVARGGPGGHGNKRFAGPTRQAPRLAERGLPGDEGWIELRLKLLADVGLVGLPNAGKSSLLARVTRAQPKVAGYPFTTLEPVLGTVERSGRQLVLADIPGLIEGASDGAGLGHDFLAHVERTRLLVHVLDLAPLDGSDPGHSFATVEAELERHDPRLARLPRILALSKADLVPADHAHRAANEWRRRLAEGVPGGRAASAQATGEVADEWAASEATAGVPVVVTSSATAQGLDELVGEIFRRMPAQQPVAAQVPASELAEHRVFRPAADRGWRVERAPEGGYRVAGRGIERLVARHDLGNEEALAYIEQRLRSLGVIDALREHGFEAGDDVEIAGVAFELDPEDVG
jgi:GTPase